MKKQALFSFVIVLFSATSVFAQIDQGSLQVHADHKINGIMNFHKQLCTNNPGLQGFRIQIFFESGNYSKEKAIEAKEKFQQNFPDEDIYLLFTEPYYKVRIGNYRTKLEAEEFLNEIAESYPEAFVVPDYIDFPNLYDENGAKEAENIIHSDE